MIARDRPTLADLRLRAHKDRHAEVGNWMAIHWARPSAIIGTWFAVRMGASAHQVTLLAMAVGLVSAVSIGTGSRGGFILGVALAYLSFWLDRVDGQLARWRGTSSLDGVYFDYLMHHATNLSLGFALGHGLALRTGWHGWSLAGFGIAAGWAGLALHNDCRYKAFFERLKIEGRSYRLDGGSGGGPAPPAPWPRRGLPALTWPAYKACEAHTVLFGLAVLAVLAAVAPSAWLQGWRIGVGIMAVMSPVLAAGRAARAVRAGGVEREFGEWFRPCPP